MSSRRIKGSSIQRQLNYAGVIADQVQLFWFLLTVVIGCQFVTLPTDDNFLQPKRIENAHSIISQYVMCVARQMYGISQHYVCTVVQNSASPTDTISYCFTILSVCIKLKHMHSCSCLKRKSIGRNDNACSVQFVKYLFTYILEQLNSPVYTSEKILQSNTKTTLPSTCYGIQYTTAGNKL